MRSLVILFAGLIGLQACQPEKQASPVSQTTFCNPMDLSYRFALDGPSRREAADPTIVWFKDRYYLFASKSGGYWSSANLLDWTFIKSDDLPLEDYAPTAAAIGDTLFFLASSQELNTLFKSSDPSTGKWSVAREKIDMPVWDPALFLDDDNRLYLYWGCSNVNPLFGVELDQQNNFAFKGAPDTLKYANPSNLGWEVPGDSNTFVKTSPWIEGSWMNKKDGKYYLQYSGPGTEFMSYSDGVYVSDNPLGPYKLQSHNPFASRAGGFATGAGHGSTFEDRYGNYWHIGTVTISQKHMFERRLALFPTFFDADGMLYSVTRFGDYPMVMPGAKLASYEEFFPGWMLLSYNKEVTVSSAIDSLPAGNMTDENIRTYWSAHSGDKGEFATIDLGVSSDVYAMQVNFAEHASTALGMSNGTHRFTIEGSNDGTNWSMVIDQAENTTDNSHRYFQLPNKVNYRFMKITNAEVPSGTFAISGFRIFGKGPGAAPAKVEGLKVVRNTNDRRSVRVTLEKVDGATGYNVRYGVDMNHMYLNFMVYGKETAVIHSLNTDLEYCFSVESFNENGVTSNDSVFIVE